FDELTRERETTDRDLLNWAESVSAGWLAGPLVYTSVVDSKTRRLPAAVAAVHMFNHGTHHRGQLTTLLKQAGIDPGVTDLPWLPGVAMIG
ncbi:MAG: damage-inducible protein DinB, partial [Betaproteobacteria bacterium]